MREFGLVAALEREARCFPPDVATVRVSGIGRERALSAARELVAGGARALVSFGVAGGLAPELAVGAALCPRRVLAADGRAFPCDPELRARILAAWRGPTPPSDAPLIEAAQPVADPPAKRALHEASGAGAVDMESAAVAQVAYEARVPFLVLRAVSDPATSRIPPAALKGLDADGRVRKAIFLRELLAAPASILELNALRHGFRAALRTLELLGEAARIGLTIEEGRAID